MNKTSKGFLIKFMLMKRNIKGKRDSFLKILKKGTNVSQAIYFVQNAHFFQELSTSPPTREENRKHFSFSIFFRIKI
jgi:hypothetical protein